MTARPGRSQIRLVRGNKLKLQLRDGQVVDVRTKKVYDVREAIEQIPWVDSGYPPPHQYVVHKHCPAIAWEVLNCTIHHHPESYLAYFRGYRFAMRYWEFEGYRFWRTSSKFYGGDLVHMLNRCQLDSVEPPRRVDQDAKPILDWGGPPWMPQGSPWPDEIEPLPGGGYRQRRDPNPKNNRGE